MGLIGRKKLSWVSLEREGSWLPNDTKLNFMGPMRPKKIVFEKVECMYQKNQTVFLERREYILILKNNVVDFSYKKV